MKTAKVIRTAIRVQPRANPLEARESWQWNQRNHRKLLIVDGLVAFLGGINISSVYSGGSFQIGSRGAKWFVPSAVRRKSPTA